MELEIKLGFRSSFNFIPQGAYNVAPQLRQELLGNGFEVGVHDLRHDGRLFASRHKFNRNAARINDYLRDWGAVGFRSGFMLHKLDWLHELDIQYDASTFDTDPYEPQPEGRDTIFPFWVSRPSLNHDSLASNGAPSKGYVELPYTLPQDSTLFLLLSERTPEIWLRKLEWVAEHGGMVLVNVHPDYLNFERGGSSGQVYPLSHYQQLLERIRDQYRGLFWHALPRDVARFIKGLDPRPSVRRQRRICMVTHSYYESDNRVTRYARALVARGDHVDVFALRRAKEQPKKEIIEGVNLFRIQDRFSKSERTKFSYLWPLLRFLVTSFTFVARHHARKPYDLVHIHNIPDFLVFAGLYPKLTGTPLILDIHDIIPEFFVSKFRIQNQGIVFALLKWMERASARFADHLILANHLWLEKYAARTGTTGRCSVLINNVDANVFTAKPRHRHDGKLLVVFPGGLQWHQGVDVAIRAFQQVVTELPNAEFHIYGDGNERESLMALASKLQLNGSVRFFETRSVREIAAIMAEADLGVVPKRADSFGNEAYSTKIMEFMSVRVPVVVSNTKVDRYYFDDSIVRFFPSGDEQALAREIVGLLRDPNLSCAMVERAAQYAIQNCWDSYAPDYLKLVESLCDPETAAGSEQPERVPHKQRLSSVSTAR
jgi:glycosyltransferase involved in cell wall biosynthesis